MSILHGCCVFVGQIREMGREVMAKKLKEGGVDFPT